jgi:hypothetical protein
MLNYQRVVGVYIDNTIEWVDISEYPFLPSHEKSSKNPPRNYGGNPSWW